MLFTYIDLIGTFVFALSGASAGMQRGFDIFGVLALSAVTATGGGILRDVSIGALPPVGMSDPKYLAVTLLAVFCASLFPKVFRTTRKTTLYLDAIGLGFFAAFGANKSWMVTGNAEVSILLGCLSGVGGGIMRDLLTGKVPGIFSREIYAVPALLGAGIQVLGSASIINPGFSMWTAILSCSLIRVLSLHHNLHLPVIRHHHPSSRRPPRP
ncbi:MAG: trimeric intracellular cation channel family protein [Planctomycetes bacterium]|nr:trimeric intracellular cation channel family protein [Planctomycetota bacterium]